MQLARRLTISLDDTLEAALAEAAERIGVAEGAADSEKLREYARLGYERALEAELDEARFATYRAWADADEMGSVARAASRRAAQRGVFQDS
jgi:hypothetical protein